MQTPTYTDTGMACGHCTTSVGADIGRLPDVLVDWTTGAVTLASTQFLEADAVRAAVNKVGYDMKEPV